ncbi:MAG: outer membrane beta-barrel protein, partial [Candidatus Omnitrophica bacterium]|nr:outer membrane beta-barrel protein [Candidatus Omnitrophota bacterium]
TKKSGIFYLIAFLFFLTQFPLKLFAEYKFLDAIEEFGERRFVRSRPSRIQAGPLRIHPRLRTKAEYDSNILMETEDEREDVIYTITPGTILQIPVDKHQLTVGYEADIEIFSKSRHAKQNDQNQTFFSLLDVHFPSWYVNVYDKLVETSSRSGTTFTDRIPRIDHAINPKAGYRWKRMTFEAGFQHFVRDFRRHSEKPFDFQSIEWSGVLFYDLFARLKAVMEYQLAQIDYPNVFYRNGTFHQVRAGVEGEILPDLVIKLRTGPQFRNYQRSYKPDFNSWVASLVTTYTIRKDLKLEFTFARQPVEATFHDVNFFKQHIFKFGGSYKFRLKWTLFADAEYKRQDYAERATVLSQTGFRHDDHFFWETGLRYAFREWLGFELAYQYFRRDSNFSIYDYTDHRVSLASNFSY